jgi:hypothetical protein
MQTPDIILACAGIILFVVLIILLFQRKIEGKTAFLLFFFVQHHLDTVKGSLAPQQRAASRTILTERYHLAR